MKKLIFSILFGLGLGASMWGQNLNEYNYVKVPEKFEFLNDKNQYQLNALTAFLFKKYGFKVLYQENFPSQVNPCEILEADVQKESGLFRTKLYVTLQNCQNEVIFTSKTGVSREKDFKTAYHEALREAFTSVESLNYSPNAEDNEVVIDPVISSGEIDAKEEKPEEVIIDPIVTSQEIKEVTDTDTETEQNPGSEAPEKQVFTNGSSTYSLRTTPTGFDLYKEGEPDKFGRLLKSGGGDNYLYSSKNLTGNAFFDTHGNLVVEYLDPNTGQLISVNYKLKDSIAIFRFPSFLKKFPLCLFSLVIPRLK